MAEDTGTMAEEESELDKPLMLFGRDVRKIPCFRSSILNGAGYGAGVGLAVFMFTSKPRLASNATVGAFVSITLTYWTYCRWEWAEQKFAMGQIHGAYKQILAEKEAAEKGIAAKDVEVVEV